MPKPLTILITPEARAALEAEVRRAGSSGSLTSGLLFGHPADEQSHLVVSAARLLAQAQAQMETVV